jgi:secreted trypsin-like serine protease
MTMTMKSFLFTLLLLACVNNGVVEGGSLRGAAANQNNRTLIINGQVAEPGDYPYFVHFATPGCGGTLIAPDIVLTAAHVSN